VRLGGLNFWAFEVGGQLACRKNEQQRRQENGQPPGDTPYSADMDRDFTSSQGELSGLRPNAL